MSEPKNAHLSKKERARLNLERKAARCPGFSSYAKRRLIEVQNEDAMEEVGELAREIFGDHKKAVQWLTKPNDALGGEMPLNALYSEKGREQVKDILGSIVDHEVPS